MWLLGYINGGCSPYIGSVPVQKTDNTDIAVELLNRRSKALEDNELQNRTVSIEIEMLSTGQ